MTALTALRYLLGGSWVVLSGVVIRVTIAITHIKGFISLLITTHEPRGREDYSAPESWFIGFGVWDSGFRVKPDGWVQVEPLLTPRACAASCRTRPRIQCIGIGRVGARAGKPPELPRTNPKH